MTKQKKRVDQKSEKLERKGENEIFRNKERVLVFSSRGISNRYRHLMLDIRNLLPHSKKEVKFDRGEKLFAINEMAELRNCSSAMYFDCKRNEDLYLWISRTPNGPSAKFQVLNVHTMDELKLSGNHLLGSRPILSFDKTFDSAPHWSLLKEMLKQVYNVPHGHPKSKPFFDHVISFHVADERIWVRNYAVEESKKRSDKKEGEDIKLVEAGPRYTLDPIRIFSGSFGGTVIYTNELYDTPGTLRAELKKAKAAAYQEKKLRKMVHDDNVEFNKPELDDVQDVFRLADGHNEDGGHLKKKAKLDLNAEEADLSDGEEVDDDFIINDDSGDDSNSS